MNSNSIFDFMGGRKFAATMLALTLGTAVELMKADGLGEAYVMLLVGAVGVFSGANALVSWRGMQVSGDTKAVEQSPKDEQIESFREQRLGLLESEHLTALQRISALEAEQQVQAQALDKATKLIAVLMQRG